ncbi:hypothetical protein NFI96_028391, partial [Prochilodus magdalenae]
CPATPFSVVDVCGGIQSSTLQQFGGNETVALPCDLTIPEYACATSLNISAKELVCVLENALMNDTYYATVEAWKLFLSRVSDKLDSALLMLSTQATSFDSLQASSFLDAVRELRLDRFTADELVDNSFISLWFGELLRPVLPPASRPFLTCMSSRNFSCQTFQTIVQTFSSLYPMSNVSSLYPMSNVSSLYPMSNVSSLYEISRFSSMYSQPWLIENEFILGFLTREQPGLDTDSLGVSTKTKAGLVTEDDPLPF